MISRKSSTLALFAWCLLGCMAAQAGETVPTAEQGKTSPIVTDPAPAAKAPAAPANTPTKVVTDETPPGKAPEVKEQAAIPASPATTDTTVTNTSTKTTVETTVKPAAPSDPTALLYAEKVAPGAFEAKRQLLLSSIKVAKKQNFGVTVYLSELNKVEDQIKQGNSSPQLEARIDSIADGLTDQLKRSQILKTQRPTGSSSASRTSYSAGPSDSGSRGHKNPDAMINELRQKFGDRIPAGMDNAELKDKLMKSDLAKEYLRKFTSGQ